MALPCQLSAGLGFGPKKLPWMQVSPDDNFRGAEKAPQVKPCSVQGAMDADDGPCLVPVPGACLPSGTLKASTPLRQPHLARGDA